MADQKDPFEGVEMSKDKGDEQNVKSSEVKNPGPNGDSLVTESNKDTKKSPPSSADLNKENFSGKDGSDAAANRFNPKAETDESGHTNGITMIKGR